MARVTGAGWGVDQAEKPHASLALHSRLDKAIGFKSIQTDAILLARDPGRVGRVLAARVLGSGWWVEGERVVYRLPNSRRRA
jgi:hypothetical protein